MFELLYTLGMVFNTFGLPGLRVLSTAIEWRMACWLRMADDTGCDKTSATDLKNGQLVPGAFMDDLLLFCVTPRLLSPPSVDKLSLPGSRTPITPCTEICESPIQDDGGASPVNEPLEYPQNDDITGYLSDESVRFHSQFSRYGYAHPLV